MPSFVFAQPYPFAVFSIMTSHTVMSTANPPIMIFPASHGAPTARNTKNPVNIAQITMHTPYLKALGIFLLQMNLLSKTARNGSVLHCPFHKGCTA